MSQFTAVRFPRALRSPTLGKCRTKVGPGLSLRGAHDGINTQNTTCLRHHLVSLRPAEGDESREDDCGDLSDRDETEGENAHCENAERSASAGRVTST